MPFLIAWLWEYIPANFFRDISVRFLSWIAGIFEDDTIISEDSRRSPKSSEEVRSFPKTSKVFRSLSTHINASSLPVLFTSKIRDRDEGIVIYSFYTWFSFLTWVNIFLMATTHIFQSGVRSKFSTRRRETHARELAGIGILHLFEHFRG